MAEREWASPVDAASHRERQLKGARQAGIVVVVAWLAVQGRGAYAAAQTVEAQTVEA